MTDYKRLDYQYKRHYERFKNRVENTKDSLPCQECGGVGGYEEIVVGDGGREPWYECGWCLGTGRVTKWIRGFWLRCKRKPNLT